MERELTPVANEAVRDGVRRVLCLVGGELELSEEPHGIPGDAGEIYDHLDGLVRIAWRTVGDDVSAYLEQLPAEVCRDCRHQLEDGFCPLRHRRMCALQTAATPVFEAIGGAPRNLSDPAYCAARAAGPSSATAADDRAASAGEPGCGCAACGASTFFG